MKHLGRKIIRAIEAENGTIPAELLGEVPNYQLIEDHHEAKQRVKTYVEELISKAENHVDLSCLPRSQKELMKPGKSCRTLNLSPKKESDRW